MVERDDDNDLRTFEALSLLRRHVVSVSSEFGERLAVRLLSLAALEEHGDPALLDVLGAVALEATQLMLAPLGDSEPQADKPPATEPALSQVKEKPDEE
jgi:hypothetical protein